MGESMESREEMRFSGVNLHNTELILTAGLPAQLVKDGIPQVALSGRSNVGKSSLVNSLLGRKKLARVSSEPGKTVTVNYYDVDRRLRLVDLPGYGFARRPKDEIAKWSALTEGYFRDNPALKLVLQLADSKVGLTEDDRTMLRYLDYYGLPYLLVATKCDRLNASELREAAGRLVSDPSLRQGTELFLYSSVKGRGRAELWTRLLRYAE